MKFEFGKSLVAAAFGLTLMSGAAFAVSAEGTWMSADGGTKVRIAKCGGERLCGRVVWLNVPNDPATGKPKTDKHNPDQAKRSRPLIGVPVVNGLRPSGEGKWSGQIYNADDGKTYQANVTVVSANAMRVEGCVLGFLCKGQTWKRAD